MPRKLLVAFVFLSAAHAFVPNVGVSTHRGLAIASSRRHVASTRVAGFKAAFQRSPRMLITGDEDITVLVIGDGSSFYELQSVYVNRRTGVRRSWSARRTRDELDALNDLLVTDLGYASVPPLPPTRAPASAVERWLARLLQEPAADVASAIPDLFAFLNAPIDVAEQPALIAEVITDDDGFTFRGSSPSSSSTNRRRWRDASASASSGSGRSARRGGGGGGGVADSTRSGAVGGAVVGGLLLGPLGAALGAFVGSSLAETNTPIAGAVKTTGATAEAAAVAAFERARRLDREYDVSGRARSAAAAAARQARKVDAEFGLSQKAGKAVRGAGDALRRAAEGLADAAREQERRR